MGDSRWLISAISWQRNGGLYVPQDWPGVSNGPAHESVLSFMREAPGYSDIFGNNLSLEGIIDRIHQLPVGYWLKFVAAVTLVCDRDGYLDPTTNERFINTFVHSDYHSALVAWVRHANHGLFSPHTLASLAKLAVGYAPETVEHSPEQPLEHIFFTYLAVHDHVQRVVIPEGTADPHTALLRFFVQNSDFAVHPAMLESFVATWSLLCEQPRASGFPLSPEAIFSTGTGVALERFLAMACAIVGLNYQVDVNSPESMVKSIIINQARIFSLSSVDPPNVEQFFGHLALTNRAIERIRQEDPNAPTYFYDFSAFRQLPLYRLGENELLPFVFSFFRWRVTSGLYWDVWFTAQSKPQYGEAIKEQFTSAFGGYFEQYIYDLFIEALPQASNLAQRIWREPGRSAQMRNVDLVIGYPGAFIFIEIKAARLKYLESMVRGELAEIEDDLRQMVYEPLCQLSDAIDHFKAGRLAEFGLEWQGESIFPVVITYGTLLYNVVLELVKGNECYQKLANTPVCMPPLILDVEEGARLASLAKNGHAITDVLRLKHQPPNENLSFRTFALQLYGDASEPKYVLEGKWERFTEIITNILFNVGDSDRSS